MAEVRRRKGEGDTAAPEDSEDSQSHPKKTQRSDSLTADSSDHVRSIVTTYL